MIGRCIFCLTAAEMSDEHVFPEAIGGGYAIKGVCAPCNSFLGSDVDVVLTDEPLVRMIRSGLALPSKSGEIPAPLHRGALVGHTEALGSVAVAADGTPKVRPELTRVATTTDEGRQVVRFFGPETDVKNALRKITERAKRKGQHVEIVEGPETTIKNAVVQKTWLAGPHRLIQPLAKIAYELTAVWLGRAYLDDPQAVSIRTCVMAGSLNDIDAQVSYLPEQSLFHEVTLPSADHAAALVLGDKCIRCFVRVFNVIEADILVSESRDRYSSAAPTFLAFDPISRSVRQRLPASDEAQYAEVRWERVGEGAGHFVVKTLLDGKVTTETRVELAAVST